MSIDYDAATIFFAAGHIRGNIWAGFTEPRQKAAITGARRILSRMLGRALSDTEVAYIEGDKTRDEYAAYEQALWMLENGPIANAEGSAAALLATQPKDKNKVRKAKRALIAPEALNWLGIASPSVVTVRG